MPYAISKPYAQAPPEDGQPFEARAIASPEDLEPWEVMAEMPEGIPTGELVWDGSKGEPRPMTEAERNAPQPLSGMEGLYAEVQRRKAQGRPDPITTDELLTMMERVQSGQVKG